MGKSLQVVFGLIYQLFVPEQIDLAKSHRVIFYVTVLLTEFPSNFYNGCCCCLSNIIIKYIIFYIKIAVFRKLCVHDFSYIVLLLDGDKRLFLGVSSKDFYIDRD